MQQPSMMQTSSLSSIQHNQQSNNGQQSTQSMLQQHPQAIRQQQQQQTSIIHQQQTPMTTMKESYLPELSEMYQKIATKLQQCVLLSSHHPSEESFPCLQEIPAITNLSQVVTGHGHTILHLSCQFLHENPCHHPAL
ncbi:hypothetical protein TSUD_95030 [Trifolium subterraneum]|uniref:Uncharacterized protein n=1 Tax=Trifolium subterraneum TaxID=3900 RepID=A0A2Z6MBU7_TRISU|nr:hypothetical protein TSUD_95030 [Trifolium subterraneum]